MATTVIAAHIKIFADFTLEQLGRHASVEEQGQRRPNHLLGRKPV